MNTDNALDFLYRGWRAEIRVASGDAFVLGHADLNLHGAFKCRLVAAGVDPPDVVDALNLSVKTFVDRWYQERHIAS